VSQYYEMGGITLWNPSNGASSLFLRQVALFEEEVGLPSGIGPMEADGAQVSPASFGTFVSALLAWRARTDHAVVQALSDGFIAACLVLIERADIEVHWPESCIGEVNVAHDVQVTSLVESSPGWETRVREQAGMLAGRMPR
jgi:hypothetical protein